jgi:hypothetical protein
MIGLGLDVTFLLIESSSGHWSYFYNVFFSCQVQSIYCPSSNMIYLYNGPGISEIIWESTSKIFLLPVHFRFICAPLTFISLFPVPC